MTKKLILIVALVAAIVGPAAALNTESPGKVGGCSILVFQTDTTSSGGCITRTCNLESTNDWPDGTTTCNYGCGDWDYCVVA